MYQKRLRLHHLELDEYLIYPRAEKRLMEYPSAPKEGIGSSRVTLFEIKM